MIDWRHGLMPCRHRAEGGNLDDGDRDGQTSATLSVVGSPANDMPLAGFGVELTRILVVDPHALVHWALVQLAACEPDLVMVGEAADADQALTIAFAARPDVVILNGSMENGQVWGSGAEDRAGQRATQARLRSADVDKPDPDDMPRSTAGEHGDDAGPS
jgi:hypothetical protein